MEPETTGPADGEGTPALRARDVTKRYGDVVVLDGVSLEVKSGEVVALVGESGVGKTTLLRMFNRMVEVDSGQIEIEGQNIRAVNPVRLRRSIGYVQQESGLLPHWNVARNVALVPWLKKSGDPDALAARALERVGMDPNDFGKRLPTELSGGQRQRVALARALAANPHIVLLDEPFRALDAITRDELVTSVRDVLHDVGVTALIVTHDLRAAMRIAHRVAVLRAGRIEQYATPDDLCREQVSPYVTDLLQRAGVELE